MKLGFFKFCKTARVAVLSEAELSGHPIHPIHPFIHPLPYLSGFLMLFGLVLFLSHSFFSPFFPFSAGGSLSKPIPEGARTHTDYPTASNSRSTMAADWWGQRYGGLISQSQDQRQRRNKVLNQSFFFSLVSFGMRKRFGMPKLLRDLLIPRIVTQPSPRFSQIFIRCPGLVLRLSSKYIYGERGSTAESAEQQGGG